MENILTKIFDYDNEDAEFIQKELKEAGIDTVELQNNVLKMLEKKQLELKIEKGRKLNELYHKLKKTVSFETVNNDEAFLNIAFRNATKNLTIDEINSINTDAKLMELLKEEVEKNKKNN